MVVAGRSKNVGMPIAMLLHTDGEHERPGGECPAGRPLMVCVTLHAQGLCGLSQGVKALKVQKGISDILAAFLLL